MNIFVIGAVRPYCVDATARSLAMAGLDVCILNNLCINLPKDVFSDHFDMFDKWNTGRVQMIESVDDLDESIPLTL